MSQQLKHGICNLSVVPMRATHKHASEMVNQLLFGETFSVINTHEEWLEIKLHHDDYTGWIDHKQCWLLPDVYFQQINKSQQHYALDLAQYTLSQADYFPILQGSVLPDYNGASFKIAGRNYTYHGEVASPNSPHTTGNQLLEYAKKYLNTPYLWGGRTSFGIDCSGFIQMVFRLMHIQLKRDAYQQAQQGSMILSLAEVQAGDLAFFGDTAEKITHVGIIMDKQRIIHAHGKVRIDELRKEGIFNTETKKYSHTLRLLKRVLPERNVNFTPTALRSNWQEGIIIHKTS